MQSKNSRSPLRVLFALDNERYEALLQPGNLYRIIPDQKGSPGGYFRVLAESGADYGHSTWRFFRWGFPKPLEKALVRRNKGNDSLARVH